MVGASVETHTGATSAEEVGEPMVAIRPEQAVGESVGEVEVVSMEDQEVGWSTGEVDEEIPLNHTSAAKRKRGTSYNAAQMEIIRKSHVEEGMGYRKIVKKFPNYGFTEQGVKTACVRIKETGSVSRKEGTGREFTARTDGNIERVRSVMESNRDATCGDAVTATGISRASAQRILKRDLELKPLRKLKAQRVKPINQAKRLEICRRWDEQIRTGELDLRKIYFTDEKLFRIGACPGGNNNLVVYVRKDLKKDQLPNDLILREDGTWQGGVSVMVALGMCYEGKGALRFVPAGAKINSKEYLEIAKNTYLRDCRRYYGFPPDCIFQQDGASSHTANVVQEFCREKFRRFWGKDDWPATSPDLNVLDYFVWGYIQAQLDKRKPRCEDTLMLAIIQSVEEMPLEMVQKAILGLAKRVKLCIQADGGVFKDRKLAGDGIVDVDIQHQSDEEGPAGDDE